MNIDDLDLNLLRVFSVLLRERSVTRAADHLGMSQPAVSNALKRLRTHLGDPLFVRGEGGIVPTPHSVKMEASIQQIMAQIENAISRHQAVNPQDIVEPILVICSDQDILRFGAKLLEILTNANCGAPIQFLPIDADYQSTTLWRHRVSCAISTLMYAPQGLIQRKLFSDEFVCLLRKDHPRAKDFDQEAYLQSEHILVAPLGSSPRGIVDETLAEMGLERRTRLVSSSFTAVPDLVRNTGLVATLPRGQVLKQSNSPDLEIRALPFAVPPFGMHLFWSERYDSDPLNQWLRQVIVEAVRQ